MPDPHDDPAQRALDDAVMRGPREARRAFADRAANDAEADRRDAEFDRVIEHDRWALAEISRDRAEHGRAQAEERRSLRDPDRGPGPSVPECRSDQQRQVDIDAVSSAETLRCQAETTRELNELDRIRAEQRRSDAEGARAAAEDLRRAAEVARAAADLLRQATEEQREVNQELLATLAHLRSRGSMD